MTAFPEKNYIFKLTIIKDCGALRDLVPFVQFMKNTYGGALLLVKVTLLHGCFPRFLNCTNGTKLRRASQL